jgi:hypothetical protein
VERGGRLGGIRARVAAHCLVRWQDFDFDTSLAQLSKRAGIGLHLALGACADDQSRRQLVEHCLEIIEHERVTIAAPPVPHDALRENDDVVRLFTAFNGYAAEAVVLQTSHGSILRKGYAIAGELDEAVAGERRDGFAIERGQGARAHSNESKGLCTTFAKRSFETTLLA